MDKYKEYLICQERGHFSNGVITGWENYSEYTCSYCGTHYYYKPEELVEIEKTKPLPPKKPKTGDIDE